VLTATVGGGTGTLTLTAQNGPISQYTVTVSSTVIGGLTVSPSTGSLASGQSAKITVTSTLLSVDTQITVNPGAHSVTVLLGVGVGLTVNRYR
jgi:hypothetical protein